MSLPQLIINVLLACSCLLSCYIQGRQNKKIKILRRIQELQKKHYDIMAQQVNALTKGIGELSLMVKKALGK